jgi:hypothetical protein
VRKHDSTRVRVEGRTDDPPARRPAGQARFLEASPIPDEWSPPRPVQRHGAGQRRKEQGCRRRASSGLGPRIEPTRQRAGRARSRRRRVGHLVAVLLTATTTLSGCLWSNPGFGPRGQGSNPWVEGLASANVPTLREVWAGDLPGTGVSQPIESAGGRGHVATDAPVDAPERHAYGLAAASGAVVWARPVLEAPDFARLDPVDASLVDGDVLVTAGVQGAQSALTARLDAATGAVVATDEGTGDRVVDAGDQTIGQTSDTYDSGSLFTTDNLLVTKSASGDPDRSWVEQHLTLDARGTRVAVGSRRIFVGGNGVVTGADEPTVRVLAFGLP